MMLIDLKLGRPLAVLLVALGLTTATAAQTPSPITASARWSDAWLPSDEPIVLELSRLPQLGEGRLALVLGNLDVTDVFQRRGTTWTFRPELAVLPAGESELVLYQVADQGSWQELSRLPVKVLTRRGFESRQVTPRLDLQSEGLLDSGGDAEAGAETGLRDVGGQIDLQGQLVRNGWNLRFGANVLATTDRQRALRFASEGEDAPRADLASYALRLARGRTALEVGHLTWGRHPQLIDSFSTRGVAVSLPMGRALRFAGGAFAGSSLVGWDNPLGLSESDHQLVAGRLEIEARPAQPGALTFGVTFLDGSKRPLPGFNQGVIDDREESSGLGLAVDARGWDGRLRFTGRWAESEFVNPADPALAQGADLVAVRPETREGRSASLAVDLLRDVAVGPRHRLGGTLELRHEQTDPQYRSLGALGILADRRHDQATLNGTLGPVALSVSHSEARDNLDDIPSILTTRTDRDAASLTLPLADLPAERAPWLPMLSAAFDRTHQRGDGIPVDSGFNASHVPDQVSDNRNLGLEWSGARWRLGWMVNGSDQDNRQPGRQGNDFETRVQEVNGWFSLNPKIDLGIALGLEASDSQATGEETENQRIGLDLAWRPAERWAFAARLSLNDGEILAPDGRAESESFTGNAEGTYRFEHRRGEHHGIGGQLFLRFSSQAYEAVDRRFSLFEDRDSWTLRAGINLSLF
ncbi:MAG: hypothetical protein AAF604_09855 [Acidobacteriota bacterium]